MVLWWPRCRGWKESQGRRGRKYLVFLAVRRLLYGIDANQVRRPTRGGDIESPVAERRGGYSPHEAVANDTTGATGPLPVALGPGSYQILGGTVSEFLQACSHQKRLALKANVCQGERCPTQAKQTRACAANPGSCRAREAPSRHSRPGSSLDGRRTLKDRRSPWPRGITMLLHQGFYSFALRRNQRARALYLKASTMASTTEAGGSAPGPWYASYPAPKSEAAGVSREDVLHMLRDEGDSAGRDFILVDLRRNDHEVCNPSVCLFFCLPTTADEFNAFPPGRDDSRIHQLACPKFVAYHSHPVRGLQGCRSTPDRLVLW